jgi:predicted RNA binding protein YcfA (HicA-like mRNA interferase family)
MEKLLAQVLSGHADASIRFTELCSLLQRLDFTMRVKGSHHSFRRHGVRERIVLQPRSGLAKPYQVRQVRLILLKYQLTLVGGSHDAAK